MSEVIIIVACFIHIRNLRIRVENLEDADLQCLVGFAALKCLGRLGVSFANPGQGFVTADNCSSQYWDKSK
ncbi:MAG: hypothetical protein HQM08_24395 [Candidatus Riflebacteria bacterium]|nr:hypothetical protein [Candidatus Riflebacteria bacterium]